MPYVFQCEACHFKMSIPDAMFARRFEGKQVTVKCKACKADIRINGATMAAEPDVRIPRPDPMSVPRPAASGLAAERISGGARPPPPRSELRKTLLGLSPEELVPRRPPPPRRTRASVATVDPLGATALDAVPAQVQSTREAVASVHRADAAVEDASPAPPTSEKPLESAPRAEPERLLELDTRPAQPNETVSGETPRDDCPRLSAVDGTAPASESAHQADTAPTGVEAEASFFDREPVTPPISWAPGPAITERKRPTFRHAWAAALVSMLGLGGGVLAAVRWMPAGDSVAAPADARANAATGQQQSPAQPGQEQQASPTRAQPTPSRAPEPAPSVAQPARAATPEQVPSATPAGPAGEPSAIPDTVRPNVLEHRVYLAMKKAQDCHRGGRARGTAQVWLTFAPNGHVTSARLEGEPIASAPVGKCVLQQAGAVRLPPYRGEPFTYRTKITLR